MNNNIENKKSDSNSSDDFELNDKIIKKISALINLKGLIELHVSDDCIARVLQSAIRDRTLSGDTLEISRKILFEKYSLNNLDPECEGKETQDMYNVVQVAFDITRLLEKSFSRSQIVRFSEVIKALSKDIDSFDNFEKNNWIVKNADGNENKKSDSNSSDNFKPFVIFNDGTVEI